MKAPLPGTITELKVQVGQQVNVGGSFTGGSARHDSGVLTRKSHIEKLTADKAELEKELAEEEQKLSALEKERESIASKTASAAEKISITETLMRAERAAYDEGSAKIEVKRALIEDLERDRENAALLAEKGSGDIASLEAELEAEQSEAEKIGAQRFDEDVSLSELRDSIDEDSDHLAEIQVAMTENRKDSESSSASAEESRSAISRIENDIEERKGEIADLEAAIGETASRVGELKAKAESLKDSLSNAEAKRHSLEEGGLDYERRINEIRHKLDEISSKKEILFVAHTKNESKLESLNSEAEKMTSRLWDEYELTETSAKTLELPEITKESRPELHRRLTELKGQIKALGHVNPDSIEEYAEQKDRYDYLGGQLKDLEKSKGELEKIISSIEDEMKTMFVKTFDEVNENFKQVFRELFGGGSAHLSLTDPDNVLTSGIEISAAPPGKMIKNLSLLSGGEQSFVAIALIFALIKVNPSPFCIFDEIEAALDEVNVTRVANYIKRYSKELQMIVISHRRGLMEVADTLYGVTMPRRGISKVFVLDVDSVSEKTMTDEQFVE